MDTNIFRLAEPLLNEALEVFRVVCLVGARQSGKSTLVRELHSRESQYVSLDDLAQLDFAQSDPIGFVNHLAVPAVIDEVQRVPELALAIKSQVDTEKREGQFILTGSTNVALDARFNDSLAGRMGIVNLYPLSQAEIQGGKGDFIARLLSDSFSNGNAPVSPTDLSHILTNGGFPEVLTKKSGRARDLWFESYISLVMSRDVKELFGIRKIGVMEKLLNLLAINCAKELNVNQLSKQTGVSRQTIEEYLSVLRKIFFVDLLPPLHVNEIKRTVKAPKVQLLDSGLVCSLRGFSEQSLLGNRELLGYVFEDFVGAELRKLISFTQMRKLRLYHYRDAQKREVDYILSNGSDINIGFEVKASMTPRKEMAKHLDFLIEKQVIKKGYVIHTGNQHTFLSENVQAIPVTCLFE